MLSHQPPALVLHKGACAPLWFGPRSRALSLLRGGEPGGAPLPLSALSTLFCPVPVHSGSIPSFPLQFFIYCRYPALVRASSPAGLFILSVFHQ